MKTFRCVALSDMPSIFSLRPWPIVTSIDWAVVGTGSCQQQDPTRFQASAQITHQLAIIENMLDALQANDQIVLFMQVKPFSNLPRIAHHKLGVCGVAK